MAGRFLTKKFSEINLKDSFFNELKSDYPGNEHSTGFIDWFNKKSNAGSEAIIFEDEQGIGAFIYLKDENEEIVLVNETLPLKPRIKIGTLRLAERYRGQRIGEGAIGLALWEWQKTHIEEIYVTVFGKHDNLIGLFERFGFGYVGDNLNGERVYIKSRKNIDYSTPYKSFPFIDPKFNKASYLIVEDRYHDTLFPYSELSNTLQEQVALSAANGISKIYIGTPKSIPKYQIGEPLLVYRKYTGDQGKPGFKSCVTSYCVITDVMLVKRDYKKLIPLDEVLNKIGNKSVFDNEDIKSKYLNAKNVIIIEMLYYGFFGAGNNVNWMWLKNNGFWPDDYPTLKEFSKEQFNTILLEGSVDVPNTIID